MESNDQNITLGGWYFRTWQLWMPCSMWVAKSNWVRLLSTITGHFFRSILIKNNARFVIHIFCANSGQVHVVISPSKKWHFYYLLHLLLIVKCCTPIYSHTQEQKKLQPNDENNFFSTGKLKKLSENHVFCANLLAELG